MISKKVSPYNWQGLVEFVKKEHANENSGHGFVHIERTIENANNLAKRYKNIDFDILTASCLLHDIAFPSKGHKDHHINGEKIARKILPKYSFPKEKIEVICSCVLNHVSAAYSVNNVLEKLPIEARILIDADNLDALGSVGIIRAIHFCVANKIPYYVNGKKDGFNDSVYGTIQKIITWDKYLLTKEAKIIAKKRIKVMEDFLKQLDIEFE
ncbi:MAG: HD domain-containing protein [archaeon]